MFITQEIVRYIARSLEEKKLLYFGMENLDFTFVDPVSKEAHVYDGVYHKRKSIFSITAFLLGSLDSRRHCARTTEGCLEVRKTHDAFCITSFGEMSCKTLCLCFTTRAEKDKVKEVEQQEEVDDSGFFAGQITLHFVSVLRIEAFHLT